MGEKPVIFVIDDEPDTLALWVRILRDTYEVVAFEDPNVALAAAVSATPALVITDHRMPNLTGVQFVRKLEEAAVECPTIMVTAFPELVEVVEAREKIFNVVPKPAKPEDLLAWARIAITSFRLKTATTRLGRLSAYKPTPAGGRGNE
ncbi:MAG: hypothetical protein A2341_28495 [Deltaproteobacteria bacterium RIFOXYB12_FULL_58_9]|nr:MAG: hypothetical protein A2341_28495 [Deltaproteobacteria bacterium RIFOXYB12_FULL_58_9]